MEANELYRDSKRETKASGCVQTDPRLEVGGESDGDGFPGDGLVDREDLFGSEGYVSANIHRFRLTKAVVLHKSAINSAK